MSDTTFRTARQPQEQAPAPTPQPDTPSSVDTKVPELLATYSEDMGNPYSAEYYDVKEVWSEEPNLKSEITEIEDYLKKQVSDGKLDNSTKAADKYLRELEKKAGTNPYESTTKRISKVLAYLEFQRVVNS